MISPKTVNHSTMPVSTFKNQLFFLHPHPRDVSVVLLFWNSGSSLVTVETYHKGRRDIEERPCVREDVSWDIDEA